MSKEILIDKKLMKDYETAERGRKLWLKLKEIIYENNFNKATLQDFGLRRMGISDVAKELEHNGEGIELAEKIMDMFYEKRNEGVI